MRFSIEIVTRGVTLERWRGIYNSPEFNQHLAASTALRARDIVLQDTLPDARERRKVRVVPDVQVPAVAKKLLGDSEIAYVEEVVYDPRTRTARLTIESEAAEQLKIAGDVRYVADADRVRVLFDGDVKVDVFAVGSVIERFIVGEVKKRYAELERELQRWVDEGR